MLCQGTLQSRRADTAEGLDNATGDKPGRRPCKDEEEVANDLNGQCALDNEDVETVAAGEWSAWTGLLAEEAGDQWKEDEEAEDAG